MERRFGLLHTAFRGFTPGFVEPDFRDRGARDYHLDATLDIDDFTKIIINTVLYDNNQHILGGYQRDPQMIAHHVEPVPVELWCWGIQRRTGLQRSYPEDLVKLSLLPSAEATRDGKGAALQPPLLQLPEGHFQALVRESPPNAQLEGSDQLRAAPDGHHLAPRSERSRPL